MEHQLPEQNAVVAVYSHHEDAENAVRKLASDGFDMTHFSIVGQGFHSEEKVVGFYNIGDRIKFWGKNGAFWGGLWSLFFGGIFLTIPVVGPVMVLGHLAAMVVAAIGLLAPAAGAVVQEHDLRHAPRGSQALHRHGEVRDGRGLPGGIDQGEVESLCCESFGGEGIDRGFSVFVAHCPRVPGAADWRGEAAGVTMPR